MTTETGNNEVRDTLITDAADLRLSISPAATGAAALSQQAQRCLRDNESSQQQLVRLVGYRGPAAASATSWDRLRREQAALQGG